MNRDDVDDARGRTPTGEDSILCDLCGTGMYDFHCRLICPKCGYQRDCSDP